MATTFDPGYVCRQCGRELRTDVTDGAAVRCPDCGLRIPVVEGVPRFPVPSGAASPASIFDRLAPLYESPLWFWPLYRFVGGPAAPLDDRERIASLLDLEGGEAVLDVACGTGRLTRRLAPAVASVLGVDVSGRMLERAQRTASRAGIENVAFARMSADDLWLETDAVDRVVCSWALHLFPDVAAALEESHRVLRPGGRFVAATLAEAYVLDLAPVRAVAREVLDAEPFTVADLHDRLRAAGFADASFDRRGAALFVEARAA
ncbi:methyltransferase domain-containing protein [Halopiger goleimassiliensis]|uniref:methyltransferase domain-containing protein n=1 Tax=Halopiger goleimassiliensis TaxID=1293048 RepID=UPI0006781883|nr:methyltransferase domain-containing protein [Halopiger goleimassiliensis]